MSSTRRAFLALAALAVVALTSVGWAPSGVARAGGGATEGAVLAQPAPGRGSFEVGAGRIVGTDGRTFVPVGTNLNGPNSFFDVPTKGLAANLQERWGFNTIRLVTCLPGGCHGAGATVNNDLDGIVAEFTDRRMVVIVDYHQLGFGDAASAADVDAAVVFWRDVARRFKANPYVWFNLFNEPDASSNDARLPSTAPARWRAQHQPVIDAIRAEGAQNVIVVDDTQSGQGAADWWQIGPSPEADSAVLSEGGNLRDPAGRLVFSVHAYDMWGFPGPNDASCANRYGDDRDTRFRSYVERARARGLTLVVGELGFRPQDDLRTGRSYHGELSGLQPPCGSTQRLSAEVVYRLAPSLGLGVLTWHGYALVAQGPQSFVLDGDPPTNLTRMGMLQYGYARMVKAAGGEVAAGSAAPGSSGVTTPLPAPSTSAATTLPVGHNPGEGAPAPRSTSADRSGPALVVAIVVVLLAIGATAAALRRRGGIPALRRRLCARPVPRPPQPAELATPGSPGSGRRPEALRPGPEPSGPPEAEGGPRLAGPPAGEGAANGTPSPDRPPSTDAASANGAADGGGAADTDDAAADDAAADDAAADDAAADDAAADDAAAGNAPGDAASGNAAADDAAAGNTPGGNAPGNDATAGNTDPGNAPGGNAPGNDATAGNTDPGNAPGDAAAGNAAADAAAAGNTPGGNDPTAGNTDLGNAPGGNAADDDAAADNYAGNDAGAGNTTGDDAGDDAAGGSRVSGD